jgi:hypothetical protein
MMRKTMIRTMRSKNWAFADSAVMLMKDQSLRICQSVRAFAAAWTAVSSECGTETADG